VIVLAAFLASVVGIQERAVAAEEDGAKRLDSWGDLLPAHCRARLGTLRLRDYGMFALAVSPTGSHAASFGHRQVSVWNLKTGELLFEQTIPGFGLMSGRSILLYSADGQTIFCGKANGVLALDAQTGKTIKMFAGEERYGHLALAGPALVGGGSRFGSIAVWHVKSGTVSRTLQQTVPVGDMDVSSDGKTLVSIGGNAPRSAIYVWDLAAGNLLRQIAGNKLTFRAVALNSRRETVAASALDGSVLLYNIKTGGVLGSLAGPPQSTRDPFFPPDVPIAFDSARDWLFVGGTDGIIRLWDVATQKEVRSFRGHRDEIIALAVHSRRQRLVSAANDGVMRVWDTSNGKELLGGWPHRGGVTCVSFRPDSYDLVSGGRKRDLHVWRFPFDKPPSRLSSQTLDETQVDDTVTCVSFSGAGDKLLTTSKQGPSLLWDMSQQTLLRTFQVGSDSGYWNGQFWPQRGEILARINRENCVPGKSQMASIWQ
jgi:WD40 repeat protein